MKLRVARACQPAAKDRGWHGTGTFGCIGAAVGVAETASAVFLLLLPYCVVAGGALTLACSLLARRDGAPGVGRVYVADSLGSIAGGVLFSFVLV